MRHFLIAAALAASPGAASAASAIVPLPAQVCSPTASDVNCRSSMIVDMRGVTSMRFSLQAWMYPQQTSSAKSALVIVQQATPGGWRCLGNPCTGIRFTEGPPGHGGTQVRVSGTVSVPDAQRLASTRLRLAVQSTLPTDVVTVEQPAIVQMYQ